MTSEMAVKPRHLLQVSASPAFVTAPTILRRPGPIQKTAMVLSPTPAIENLLAGSVFMGGLVQFRKINAGIKGVCG